MVFATHGSVSEDTAEAENNFLIWNKHESPWVKGTKKGQREPKLPLPLKVEIKQTLDRRCDTRLACGLL